MKTPREILLARHRTTEPKLDAVRQSVVTAVCRASKEAIQRQSPAAATAIWQTFWRELILPSRNIWAGLATAWVFILAINFTQREASPVGHVSAAPVMMSVGEQQRWLNQLFADRLPAAEAEPPKTFSPKPRTEITEFFTV
jgi:hypothetical protein